MEIKSKIKNEAKIKRSRKLKKSAILNFNNHWHYGLADIIKKILISEFKIIYYESGFSQF